MIDAVVSSNPGHGNEYIERERAHLSQYVDESSAVPQNNTPVDTGKTDGSSIDELWVSATALAQALAKYAEDTGLREPLALPTEGVEIKKNNKRVASSSQGECQECCKRGTCSTLKRDSPRSPESESQTDNETEGSEVETNTDNGGYRPIVSPITSEATEVQKPQEVLTSSQRYWQERPGTRRVACVRPRTRGVRPSLRRRLFAPMAYRMYIQAPILQTRVVFSRVIMADGSIVEEELRERFVMARTVATQTYFQDTVEFAAPEADNVPEEVEVVIDLTEGENGEDSSGTPVQDEKKPVEKQ
jgi:hypothetical protein